MYASLYLARIYPIFIQRTDLIKFINACQHSILNTCYWEDLSRFILKASLPDQPLRKACLRAWENKETPRT